MSVPVTQMVIHLDYPLFLEPQFIPHTVYSLPPLLKNYYTNAHRSLSEVFVDGIRFEPK